MSLNVLTPAKSAFPVRYAITSGLSMTPELLSCRFMQSNRGQHGKINQTEISGVISRQCTSLERTVQATQKRKSDAGINAISEIGQTKRAIGVNSHRTDVRATDSGRPGTSCFQPDSAGGSQWRC